MVNKMECSHFFVISNIIALIFFFDLHYYYCYDAKSIVDIGVVLDLNSPLGSMTELCMKMALSDFNSKYPNSTTQMRLHVKNAESVLDANFAVLDLLKNEQVHGILRPQIETEETLFVAELGDKVHVPIISFTARSSNTDHNVKTTSDIDAVQAQAIASICQYYKWPAIVVLYEDTNYGNRFLSHMSKAFQDVNIRIAYISPIPISAKDDQILTELKNLTTKETKVYLVHMNPSLGYRLFALAKNSGMMSEGYEWLISDSLSISLDSIDSVTRDSMEGVVGVRPYVYRSKELENFEERWRRNMILENKTFLSPSMGLNIYGLWAYDAVTSLAIAVENIGPVNSNSFYVNGTYNNNTDLRISAFGPRLVNELSRTKFRGLTGDFELIDGKMKLSAFEIFNVIGSGEKTVGFWTRDRGITRELKSTSTKELKNIIWPGDNIKLPKVLDIIATRNLRVGVPWKSGFQEFVNVTIDHKTNITNATGFAIDIFLATLKLMLPISINIDYHMYNDTNNTDWSYDDMLQELPKDAYDMVVGDATIWAPRANYVDFSLPYSESGVILVVKNRKQFDMWTFVKPLRWDLWLAIIGACILVGIVVRILEDQGTRNGAEDHLINERPAAGMVYLSPVVVLAFPERNMVSNNWSFVVLVFWLFMAFILMQSYTANLSAILTVDHLKFAFSNNYYIGYQHSSFMRKYLVEHLNISELKLRNYSSAEEYHRAMSLGSEKGGIDAIFDEIPYMKIFMNRYDSQYKMVGPTYKTGGFGFAFPHGSPLVVSFSKAILDVTQGPDMTFIEQKNLGPGYSSQDPLSSTISQGASSLTFSEFAGLFFIIGSVILFALFCSETPIGRKFIEMMGIFVHICFRSRTSRVDSIEEGREEENSHESMHDNVASLPLGEGMDGVPHDFNGDVYQHSETEIRETITSDEPFVTHDLGVPIDNNGEHIGHGIDMVPLYITRN